MSANSPTSSGTYDYAPTGSELILEAFSRIQMYGPQLQVRHVIEARRSANLMFSRLPNRGPSLWLIGDQPLVIPLTSGVATYDLPDNTIDILDGWRRIYTASSTFTTLGNALTPELANGVPVVTAQGDPAVLGPGSGTLSTVAGSQEVGLRWPSHGLAVGSPLFWQIPASCGGLVFDNFNVVDSVVDQNNVTFQATTPALWTSPNPIGGFPQGGTPLFYTQAGSGIINVILPQHELSIGDMFPVEIAVTVGGLTIPNNFYTVTGVVNSYQFQLSPGLGNATSNDAVFENSGQINVGTQASNTQYSDIFLYPFSRDDWAMLPDKQTPGVPTQYWFNRTINPSVTLWPVPPAQSANQFIAMVAFRMRKVQDFNPLAAQTPDLPSRFFDWSAAELCARLCEKFRPEMHEKKLALAAIAWAEASLEDREKVSLMVSPDFGSYYL